MMAVLGVETGDIFSFVWLNLHCSGVSSKESSPEIDDKKEKKHKKNKKEKKKKNDKENFSPQKSIIFSKTYSVAMKQV